MGGKASKHGYQMFKDDAKAIVENLRTVNKDNHVDDPVYSEDLSKENVLEVYECVCKGLQIQDATEVAEQYSEKYNMNVEVSSGTTDGRFTPVLEITIYKGSKHDLMTRILVFLWKFLKQLFFYLLLIALVLLVVDKWNLWPTGMKLDL